MRYATTSVSLGGTVALTFLTATVRRATELYSGLHVLLLDGQLLQVTGLEDR